MKKNLCLLVLCMGMMFNNGSTQRKHAETHKHKLAGRTGKKKHASKAQYGVGSFYANKFIGRKTASGKTFSQSKFTAAHNTVPLGTWLRVTNMRNKKTVLVKVTDRMHRKNRRVVDLSRSAAALLGTSAKGLLKVKVETLGTTAAYASSK